MDHRKFFHLLVSKQHVWLATVVVATIEPSVPAFAQLVPDATLGSQSSTLITTKGSVDTVTGGIRTGGNQFYSFREFNVGSGRSLYFNDPGVSNILTRVTGPNPSSINGRLGVNGNANLFLINPNGILFGSGASLDIRGSFVATTASAVKFSDGNEFSATHPTIPNLLTIAVPIGLQRGISQPEAAIANQGNLTTGRDLTLDADRLDLQGQLQAGRNLTLQAQDTLQVRDSSNEPFRAIAGNNLSMQGNSSIDILALSHPQTLIQAGNNLTLISDGTISGDAYFSSGGNLSFLTTTGTPGIFVSLFDPIIQAEGNVTFGNYTGAALKVEATGSIQGGNIRITAPDTTIPTTDPDYTTLTTLPAVILRAGLATVAGANVPQTAGGTTFNSTPSLAGSITTGAINTSSTTGAGGSIILEARNGNIQTANLTSRAQNNVSNSVTKNGGDITLTATNGSIIVTPNISTTAAIDTTSGTGAFRSAAGNAGAVRLTATGGKIQVNGTIVTESNSGNLNFSGTSGKGGKVTLVATGDVEVRSRISTRSTSSLNQAGNGGEIALTSTHGNIQSDTLDSNVSAGPYNVSRPAGTPPNAGFYFVIAANGAKGGDITLTAPNGSISTNPISSGASETGGKGGDVQMSAWGNIQTANITTDGQSYFKSTAAAGAVNLTSTEGSLQTGFIRATAVADFYRIQMGQPYSSFVAPPRGPSIQGQGGNVQLSAPGAISIGGVGDATNGVVVVSGQRGILTSGGAGAGNITIASQTAFVADRVLIGSDTFGSGRGGDIAIAAPSITLINGAQISTSTHSSGSGGTVTLQAPEFVAIQGSTSQAPGIGLASLAGVTGFPPGTDLGGYALTVGDGFVSTSPNPSSSTFSFLTLPAGTLYPSGVFTQVSGLGTGNAGNLNIQTGQLIVQDRGTIAATTFGMGNAGTLILQANDISLRNGGILTGVATGASGNGGAIDIQARSLTLTNQAQIRATTLGTGPAGDIQVQADAVNISGEFSGIISGSGTPSQIGGKVGDGGTVRLKTDTLQITDDGIIGTSTFTAGQGGNIEVTARAIGLASGGQLSATAEDQGNAGSIAITARDLVTISGAPSGIFASTGPRSSGNGGSIFLSTGQLLVQDRARITVDSRGSGKGGDIQLSANRLDLSNQAKLFAETVGTQGGNIQIQARDILLLRRNSLISASAGTAQAGGNGGNITIKAGFVVGVLEENSDISANAFTGNGGRVEITAQGIFGLKFQPRLTSFSDITASSQFGINGTVTLNTLNTDPNRGAVQLPDNFADSSNQMAQTCSTQQQGNSFVITGRGGLSPDPAEALNQTIVWTDEGERERRGKGDAGRGEVREREPMQPSIVEMTRWVKNTDGSVSLVADTDHAFSLIAAQNCQSIPVEQR